jgi:hypothetical protein
LQVLGEQVVVEVADDRADAGGGRVRGDLVDVDEALATRRRLGVRRSCGSAATIRPATRAALTRMSFAKPGWTSTPVTVIVASTAENVSSWISPTVEPSSV